MLVTVNNIALGPTLAHDGWYSDEGLAQGMYSPRGPHRCTTHHGPVYQCRDLFVQGN